MSKLKLLSIADIDRSGCGRLQYDSEQLPATGIKGDINMLEIGTKAPAFTLPDKDGNLVSLSDFAGKKTVLYFYPCGLNTFRLVVAYSCVNDVF